MWCVRHGGPGGSLKGGSHEGVKARRTWVFLEGAGKQGRAGHGDGGGVAACVDLWIHQFLGKDLGWWACLGQLDPGSRVPGGHVEGAGSRIQGWVSGGAGSRIQGTRGPGWWTLGIVGLGDLGSWILGAWLLDIIGTYWWIMGGVPGVFVSLTRSLYIGGALFGLTFGMLRHPYLTHDWLGSQCVAASLLLLLQLLALNHT